MPIPMPTLQERMCLVSNIPSSLFPPYISHIFWAHTVAAGNFSNANSDATCVCLRIILIGAEIFFLCLICIPRWRERDGEEEEQSSGPTSSSIVNRQRRHQSTLLARSSCRRRLRLLLENWRPLHHGQTSLVACTSSSILDSVVAVSVAVDVASSLSLLSLFVPSFLPFVAVVAITSRSI